MRTTPEGIQLIKDSEGCRLTSYQDIAGRYTIGYGHTLGVIAGEYITQEQADAFLIEDVERAERQVLELVTVDLTDAQLSALVSFTYNEGVRRLAMSTLLKKVNCGAIREAGDEFMRWVYCQGFILPGLVTRRNKERALFLSGDSNATVGLDYSPA